MNSTSTEVILRKYKKTLPKIFHRYQSMAITFISACKFLSGIY